MYRNAPSLSGGGQHRRVNEKGLISNPVGKAKSISLTKEGIELAQKIATELFGESES